MVASLFNKKTYIGVGVMSGTSCDGLDVAVCKFENTEGGWDYTILEAETLPYEDALLAIFEKSFNGNGDELVELDFRYGKYIGEQLTEFLFSLNYSIDFIASHGHTIFHQPGKGYTFQLGSGAAIAATIKLPVIADFRSTNVALRGQGAPLVPIGDAYLFGQYDACVNIGGFSNISFNKKGQRVAFDVCPVNIVLNRYANEYGEIYDKGGDLAQQGTLHSQLFEELNTLPFFAHHGESKSLGREWVEDTVIPILTTYQLSGIDVLRTYTEHAAYQIARVLNENKINNALFTGGGVYNTFLMERVKHYSLTTELHIPTNKLTDFKEALIFAFLGVLYFQSADNILSSYTGASRNCIGGALYQ